MGTDGACLAEVLDVDVQQIQLCACLGFGATVVLVKGRVLHLSLFLGSFSRHSQRCVIVETVVLVIKQRGHGVLVQESLVLSYFDILAVRSLVAVKQNVFDSKLGPRYSLSIELVVFVIFIFIGWDPFLQSFSTLSGWTVLQSSLTLKLKWVLFA